MEDKRRRPAARSAPMGGFSSHRVALSAAGKEPAELRRLLVVRHRQLAHRDRRRVDAGRQDGEERRRLRGRPRGRSHVRPRLHCQPGPERRRELRGERVSFTTAEDDDDDTDLDEESEFEFEDVVAGAYSVVDPSGWGAPLLAERCPRPTRVRRCPPHDQADYAYLLRPCRRRRRICRGRRERERER